MLNRSNAFTGINVKNAEGALQAHDRPPGRERVPRRDQRAQQRRAVHVHRQADSLLGRSLLEFARAVDKLAPVGGGRLAQRRPGARLTAGRCMRPVSAR